MATVAVDSVESSSVDLKPTEGNIPDFTVTAGTSSYKDNLLDSLQKFREHEYMTDCEIHVNDTTFHAHSLILASACDFFKSKFSFDSKYEKVKTDIKVKITLDNLDKDVFSLIMDYLYSGDIKIAFAQIKEFIETCEFLLLLDIKKKCEAYIVLHVKPDQCISWARFAYMHNLTLVADRCNDVLKDAFNVISSGSEFYGVSLTELIEIIKSQSASNPDDCLQACISWIMHDLSHRKQHMLCIIEHIALEKCSAIKLDYMNEEYVELMSHPDILKRMLKAMLNKSFSSGSACSSNAGTQHSMVSFTPSKEIKYLLQNKSWKKLTDMPHDARLHNAQIQCCVVPNGIFVYANAVGSPPLRPCYVFNTLYKSWQLVLKTHDDSRDNYALVNIANNIYILGGDDKDKTPLNTVQCVDLEHRAVFPKPNMIYPTVAPLAVALRSYIYVVVLDSDENDASHTFNLQCFNSAMGVWKLKSKIPEDIQTIYASSAVAAEGKMYIVGGAGPTCAAYDPKSDNWSILQPPPGVRKWSTVLYDNGRIVLLGGEIIMEEHSGSSESSSDDFEYTNTDKVIEYDIFEDRWSHCNYTLPRSSAESFVAKVMIKKEK